MIRAPDPNQMFRSTPFSPPPFIQIPDEPRPLSKMPFAPRSTLFRPNWPGPIKDTVNLMP